jgi:hypothetical protein
LVAVIVSIGPRESAFVFGHHRKIEKYLGTGRLQGHDDDDDAEFLPDGDSG